MACCATAAPVAAPGLGPAGDAGPVAAGLVAAGLVAAGPAAAVAAVAEFAAAAGGAGDTENVPSQLWPSDLG